MEEIISHLKTNLPSLLEIIGFGILFYGIERLNPAEKDTPFFKSDFKNEVFLAVINMIVFIPISVFIAALFIDITIRPIIGEQLFDAQIQSLPLAIQIILGAVLIDFGTYWKHRFAHYYLWSYHSVHHSAEQITWITALRLHPIENLAGIMLGSVLLYFFGFDGVGFIGALLVVHLMNYFTHINLDLKFPAPLRYVLASPAFHRWHHADVKSAYDKNFCGMFPFLDLAFGTYHHPEDLPPKYGLSAREQKAFPENSVFGWLTYPFRRDINFWKKRFGYGKNSND